MRAELRLAQWPGEPPRRCAFELPIRVARQQHISRRPATLTSNEQVVGPVGELHHGNENEHKLVHESCNEGAMCGDLRMDALRCFCGGSRQRAGE